MLHLVFSNWLEERVYEDLELLVFALFLKLYHEQMPLIINWGVKVIYLPLIDYGGYLP